MRMTAFDARPPNLVERAAWLRVLASQIPLSLEGCTSPLVPVASLEWSCVDADVEFQQ